MNQTISELIEPTCDHMEEIIVSGKVICQKCGLEIREHYTNSIFMRGSFNNEYKGTKQYVGNPKQHRYYNGLGSVINIDKKVLKGTKDISKFSRLRKIQITSINENNKIDIALRILEDINNIINLPKYILNDCAVRFKKLINANINIINRVSCLCFCVWDSIRHFKYKTSLKELLEVFRKMGHRVNGKSIIRDGCLYRETLFQKGIRKTSAKQMRDYIARHIANLSNNYDNIEERLIKKKLIMKPEIFISQLESICYMVCDRLECYFSGLGLNPFDSAAGCIYFASLILSNRYNRKKLMIQKQIATITNVPAYTIREIYCNHFKPFL